MNDSLILRMIAAGRLRVDLQTGRVWYRRRSNWVEKKALYDPAKGRYRFQFQFGKKKTTINRSRFLYLAKHAKSAPVVDHRDLDRTNDSVDNLGAHSRAESDRQGREAQKRKVVDDAINFFEYIAFWGEEPPPDVFPAPSVSRRG